ncbi:MAG TPA: hypothetical protein PLH94_05750 [Fimbriimonadaceae bacterium]|nr:hypothetical protein [Fimbriimonadaceae bacterium]
MEDIVRQDRRLLVRELIRPRRVFALCATGLALWLLLPVVGIPRVWIVVLAAVWAAAAYLASSKRRFQNRRYELLWNACEDRLEKFGVALKAMKRDQIAEFAEMPNTIREVANSLYLALRRADLVFLEISKSEGWLQGTSGIHTPTPNDPQAKELYRIADKNVAEYKRHFDAVMAGVQRAEAQAAVFTTTLDTLRMKMLGYRLTGRKPELSTQEFLESLTEAKLQLEAIDKALDELELSPFPTTVTILPDAPPVEEQRLF